MVFALVATMFACGDDDGNLELPTLPGMYKTTYSITIDGQKFEGTLKNGIAHRTEDGLNTFIAVNGDINKEEIGFGISANGYSDKVGESAKIDGDGVGFAVINVMLNGKKTSVYSTIGTITREAANKVSFSGKVGVGTDKLVKASGYIVSEAFSKPSTDLWK